MTVLSGICKDSQYVGVVGGPTVRRCGCKFEIPATYVENFGVINKEVMELVRNATREAIEQLTAMGVICSFDC